MIRFAIQMAAGLLISGGAAYAAPVNPQAMWFNGLDLVQGSFQFVQVASPGGLWLEDTLPDGHTRKTQISINETPALLREKLLNAKIELRVSPGSSIKTADQAPSPGPHGQPPFFGQLRHYDETARGTLVVQGLPGIGLIDGDAGEFQGAVDFTLSSSHHSDPSDVGVFQERFQGEMIWGAAAQSRNYADLSATKTALGGNADPSAQVLANARLLRGGREIISYVEWIDPTPPAGVTERKVRGSVRLFRL